MTYSWECRGQCGRVGELVGVTLTIKKSHSSDLVILLARLERVDLFLGVEGSVWESGQVGLCNTHH